MEKAAYVYSRDESDSPDNRRWPWSRESKNNVKESKETLKESTKGVAVSNVVAKKPQPDKATLFALAILPTVESPNPRSQVCACGD